jgi:hypothetical protein
MRRLAQIFVVALLVLSASGVQAISWTDPCEGEAESAPGGDQSCPPTCFTCGCCAQAIEPLEVEILPSVDQVVPPSPSLNPPPASREPRGILHVPKLSV